MDLISKQDEAKVAVLELHRAREGRLFGPEEIYELVSTEIVHLVFLLQAEIDDSLLAIQPFGLLLGRLIEKARDLGYPDAKIAVFEFDDENEVWNIRIFLGEPHDKEAVTNPKQVEELLEELLDDEDIGFSVDQVDFKVLDRPYLADRGP